MQREEEKSKEKSNVEDTLSKHLYPVYTSYVSTGRSDQNWWSTFQDYVNQKADEITLKYENEKWSIARISENKVESKDNDININDEIIPFSTLVLVAISDGKANLKLLDIFDKDSQQNIIQCLIDFFSAQFSMKPSNQPGERSVFDDPTDGTAKVLFKNAKGFFELTQKKENLPKPTFTFDENKYLPKQQETLKGSKESSTEESSGCFPRIWKSQSKQAETQSHSERLRVEEIRKGKSHGDEEERSDLEMDKLGGSNNSNS